MSSVLWSWRHCALECESVHAGHFPLASRWALHVHRKDALEGRKEPPPETGEELSSDAQTAGVSRLCRPHRRHTPVSDTQREGLPLSSQSPDNPVHGLGHWGRCVETDRSPGVGRPPVRGRPAGGHEAVRHPSRGSPHGAPTVFPRPCSWT